MKKHLFFLLFVFSSWASFAQTIRYVKEGGAGTKDGTSWSNASDDLQLMINQSASSNQIWVAAGTYKPNRLAYNLNTISINNRENAFVLKDDVQLYGGFNGTETSLGQRNYKVNKSILSGDLGTLNNTADDTYHVIISANVGNQTLLDGFTITKGNANGSQNSTITVNGRSFAQSRGGGMCNGSSSATITNCTFTENTGTYAGAMYNDSSPVSISNSNFSTNQATANCAGIMNISSNAVIINSSFTKNTSGAWGGALLNDNSAATISGCTFIENYAGNRGGAIHNDNSGPKIYTSLFFKNTVNTNGGGAIWHNNGNMSIINCTMYGNIANNSSYGGGIHANNGRILLYNSLLWDNKSGQDTGRDGQYTGLSYITFNNNLIKGYTNIMGDNVSAQGVTTEQIFTNAANNDFQLKIGSPAIAKGSNSLYSSSGADLANDKDLAGNNRLIGFNIDIGAYESKLLPQTITVADITKTYGDSPFALTATASSGLKVNYVSADNSIAEAFLDVAGGNRWRLKIKKAGEVNITAKQPGDDTYGPAPDAVFKLTINKANLAVTANALSKEYGTADPALTYTVTGFANGDDQTVLTGSLSRAVGEAIGTYAINQGTLVANSNYDITYTGANFSITTATGDFVTIWDMSKPGINNEIAFNITTSPIGSVDYFWTASGGSTGSGTIAANAVNVVINGLPANEIITLNLKPNHLRAFRADTGGSDKRLVDVAQWGTAQWSTMESMFQKCINLNINASDIPDLSKATSMLRMFQDCQSLNSPANIGNWNTSKITNMAYIFYEARIFNQNISGWNTSAVTNMSYMFSNASVFNQPIGNWDTSKVTNMTGMFSSAKAFNQNIGDWDTQNVTDMSFMFYGTETFNQNINNWNTSKVKDMTSMFANASFNMDIGSWNTSAVANMNNMFSNAWYFNQGISNWNTANVTNMSGMFQNSIFNQPIGNWNTSNVTNMSSMFTNNSAFNQNIGNWNTSNVTNMTQMFRYSKAFNSDISNWDTSNVASMAFMFSEAIAFNQNIGSWNTENVNNMMGLFERASAFNQNIGEWKLNSNVSMANMLDNSGMDCTNYSFTLQGWANNANTPSGRNLRAIGRQYGTNAVPARTLLTTTKGWTITGDSPSGQSCGLTQTITATDMVKTYGDAPFVPTASASSDLEVSYVSADNSIAEAFQDSADGNKWKLKINKAGVVNITAKQAGNETYNPASDVIFKLTINKATLTVTADTISKIYGTEDPILTYVANGWVNGDTETVLTGLLTRTAGENVGTYAIGQGTLNTENYTITYTGADFNITKATLNIVAEAKSKVYGSADPALTYTATGFENGDDQSVITGALTRAAGENIGNYDIEQGTLAVSGNYDISFTGANFNITKATLNIVAEAKSKVYGSADPALTYTVTGFENGDDQSVITGALTREAGENIGTYAIEQGTLATTANYDITYTAADFIITKATLNIVAEAKSKVYGSADPALTYTVTGFENGDDHTVITGALTRVAGENIGTYAIEQGTLAVSGNYDIVYTGADFNITKATLNIVADAKTKVYGTNDPALTYTVTGFENGDDQSVITGALTRTAGEDIGTYAIEQGTLAVSGNYDIAYTGADFNITKATLNIVADTKSKTYGTADPVLTYTVTGFENGDDQSVITGALTRVAGENIGTYAINQGTLAVSGNYDIAYTGADFNITKATLNIVADAKSKAYGTADPVLTYSVTGFANGDDHTVITGALTRTAGENIGTYAINQGTLAVSGNYDIAYTGSDFNITKATLNIVADAKSKAYGTADPALTYTVTGFANGDDHTVITGALTRTAGENIGTYAIEQGTLATTANYDITYTAADFTITKATLNIVAEAKSKVYGSADPALIYTVTGFANGDDQSVITGALTRVAGEDIGTYAIKQGTLAVSGNYDIAYTGADFNITKATLNIIADAKSKTYGTADPALTYSVTGLANGDDHTVIIGALTRTAGENIGTYAINQGTLAVSGNYDIAYTDADFNITKATLNIVADAKSKIYGTADPALTYTVTGLVNGDNESVVTGALIRTAGEDIGTYAIEQGTLAVSGNYDIVYTGADFNITKATLNIIANTKSKTYGTADPALTYTVTGLANGDDHTVITGTLARTAGEDIGTYSIEQGTLAVSGNYEIAYTGADFNITKATLNIVADAKSKTYGTADPVLTYSVTGFANGDNESIITGALTRMAGENIGTYTIEQGTLATTANYDITYTAADFTITKATLNIVAEAKSKVYGSADPALTYTVTGFANGDDHTVITGALTRIAGEDIGTYAINQGTLAVSGNYEITYTGADFNITKATLNIVADAESKTYGTADPALTYSVTGFANGDDHTVITGTLARTAGEDIGTYAINQGTLAVSGNYEIAYTGADFNITKATLNIIADTKSKTYGTADPALTYTVTGLANGDDHTVITGALTRIAGEDIGTYAINQGTLAVSGNYDIAYTGADFNITKATLNIVADAKTKVYGTNDPALTYTVTGFANGDDHTVITGTLARTAGEDIGTYAINLGTLAVSGNYDIAYTGADFNITKATLNIVADAKSKTYGTNDPALTYSVTGLANGDDHTVITGTLARTAGEDIGTYAINQGTLAVSGNYDIAYTGADFNITKATLNIVADAKTKVYGTNDPALTYTVTGFANGDDHTVITGTLARTAGEDIGTYAINLGTLAVSGNYDIAYTGADFNITKATLNIVADAKSKTYGTNDPALTYSVTGLANGDDHTVITGTLARTAGEDIGTYAINQGTLAVSGNYDIAYTGADFNITKATLNIVADAKSKTYGTNDPALTYTVTGFANGDDHTVITGALTRATGEAVGTYPITQGTLSAGNNYDIAFTGADFTIIETLAITDSSQTNVTCYGGTDGSATVSISGGTAPYSYSWSPNGGTAPAAAGLAAGTYTVTVTDSNGSIITKVFTITQPQEVAPPTAEEIQEFCGTANPTISDLEIQGTQVRWYASANATQELPASTLLVDGTTYYATQTVNGCESPERTLVIVILNDRLPIPQGAPLQEFEQGATIADLMVTPANVIWYASHDDAVNNANPLPPTTLLVDGATYYAVAVADGQCPSLPLAVTVNAALGVGKPQKLTFKYYPNPVEDYLNIQCSENIDSIEVYSLLGQLVRKQDGHAMEVKLFLGDLPDGTYAVSVMSNGKKSTVKVVKK
jgi:surface protein